MVIDFSNITQSLATRPSRSWLTPASRKCPTSSRGWNHTWLALPSIVQGGRPSPVDGGCLPPQPLKGHEPAEEEEEEEDRQLDEDDQEVIKKHATHGGECIFSRPYLEITGHHQPQKYFGFKSTIVRMVGFSVHLISAYFDHSLGMDAGINAVKSQNIIAMVDGIRDSDPLNVEVAIDVCPGSGSLCVFVCGGVCTMCSVYLCLCLCVLDACSWISGRGDSTLEPRAMLVCV